MNAHPHRLRAQAAFQTRKVGETAMLKRNSKATRTSTASGIELAEVYRGYAKDLIKFARRWGFSPEDAEDSAQEFFLRLEEKDSLKRFDRAKGEFRSFLLTLFQRFLTNRWHSLHVVRRGGTAQTLPLGTLGESNNALIDWMTPEKMAHLHWARLVLEHAFEKLRKDLLRQGKARLFDALSPHLLHKSAGTSYASLARRVGLSDAATRMTVSRYRERLRLLICRELEGNKSGNGRVPDVVRDLFDIFDS